MRVFCSCRNIHWSHFTRHLYVSRSCFFRDSIDQIKTESKSSLESLDANVSAMLSTIFRVSLGLFESIRSFFWNLLWSVLILRRLFVTAESPSRKILYTTKIEGIVLLENRHNTLPLRFPSSSGLRFCTFLLTILRLHFPQFHHSK